MLSACVCACVRARECPCVYVCVCLSDNLSVHLSAASFPLLFAALSMQHTLTALFIAATNFSNCSISLSLSESAAAKRKVACACACVTDTDTDIDTLTDTQAQARPRSRSHTHSLTNKHTHAHTLSPDLTHESLGHGTSWEMSLKNIEPTNSSFSALRLPFFHACSAAANIKQAIHSAVHQHQGTRAA